MCHNVLHNHGAIPQHDSWATQFGIGYVQVDSQHHSIKTLNNLAGRTQGLRSQTRSLTAGRADLKEAVKRLECLSKAEREVLSSKTAQLWDKMWGQNSVGETDGTSWQDLFNTAIKAVQSGDVRIAKNNSGLILNDSFLKTQSPFLQTARGFKTR